MSPHREIIRYARALGFDVQFTRGSNHFCFRRPGTKAVFTQATSLYESSVPSMRAKLRRAVRQSQGQAS